MKIRTDFVTNSSSDCFVYTTDKTVDDVKELLSKLLETFNIFSGLDLKFNDVFGNIFVLGSVYRENDHWDPGTNPDNIGKVLIYSDSDNSIPWAMQEFLEVLPDCERHHLG